MLVDITVVSATQLSIDDPVLTPAICGTNTVVATGPSQTAQGGISTQTANFTLTCPDHPGGGDATTQGRLSLTGANTLRYRRRRPGPRGRRLHGPGRHPPPPGRHRRLIG